MNKFSIYLSILLFIFSACNSEKNARTYRIPKTESENIKIFAELSITKFPGDAGGIEANVNRWRKQLNLLPQSLAQINKLAFKEESGIGAYTTYKIINESDVSKAFLCIILPYNDATIFVKLSSSLKGINQLEQEFILFCSSFNLSTSSEIIWDTPDYWIESNKSDMHLGKYQIPH